MSAQGVNGCIDLAEVRSQQVAELSELLRAKRSELGAARFKHNGGQRGKTHLLAQMRRNIARIALVLSQKIKSERGAAEVAHAAAPVESSKP